MRSADLLALLALAGSPAMAQDTTTVLVGARVRIEATRQVDNRLEHYTLVGNLAAFDSVRLYLGAPGRVRIDSVPHVFVVSAQVSREYTPRLASTARGALGGAILGGVVYGMYRLFKSNDHPGAQNPYSTTEPREEKADVNDKVGKLSIPLGTAFGALFGLINSGDQWLKFRVPGDLGAPR
jgi:hypothetical protein